MFQSIKRPGTVGIFLAALLFAVRAAYAQSDQEAELEHQGLTRHYELHLPPGPPDAGPRPLIVALHGLDKDADWHHSVGWLRAWWTMDAVADREGFVVAYPAAIGGRWSYSPQRPVPIPGRTELVDDLGFLGALIDKLVADRVADPARIFVTGPSRGGLMTWSMACSMSERIAAVAPLITGMTDGQLENCHPAHLVPVLALGGTADRSQPYEGWLYQDHDQGDYRLASVPETMEFWRHLHNCTGEASQGLPHREGTGPTRVALITWTGCTGGGTVQLLRIQGGGHQLPTLAPAAEPTAQAGNARNHDIETAEEVWRFFNHQPD
jgi:polyhydroxybutyrate depolymerase